MMMNANTVLVDGRVVEVEEDRNLLELIRRVGIEIPTFCYHSELSIYGACRLCLVEVEGRGVMASCSTAPEPGMVVRTMTEEIRQMRKINLELLLANHNRECPTCTRSSNCTLQDLARRLGVEEVRFKERAEKLPLDTSSPSLMRDPNKCVLCGDCVRMCSEVQGIGAIDFAHRGSDATVAPAFGKDLDQVECVNCGQCAAVCPTGAIIPKQDREPVWQAIHDPEKTVAVQVAPAIRVALGEAFGKEPGAIVTGQVVAALKRMGFDYVYDTCFAADMTILEEGTEFLHRFTEKKDLPLMTSCCPGWVKYAETAFPEILNHLSTCRSPQQMFGRVARDGLPEELGVAPEDLVIVSLMPCTAKKYEAQLPKFERDGRRDVDYVLTTQEVGRMMHGMGLQFDELAPEAFDMPMGFGTGAGVIFGTSGGVMEAALRYAVERATGETLRDVIFTAVRGMEGVKAVELDVKGTPVRVAVAHGLANAASLAKDVRDGTSEYDFIEVMACPGGCVSGAGQPIAQNPEARVRRSQALYQADVGMQVQKSQDNHQVKACYGRCFGEPGSPQAHEALHTCYEDRSAVLSPTGE
ncbi:MAG: NADH-dependent [FeFe] hydrogenase, group A6 [Planctomycetota bacterium]|jgi:NADH-quinone oxidoreductase subunit G